MPPFLQKNISVAFLFLICHTTSYADDSEYARSHRRLLITFIQNHDFNNVYEFPYAGFNLNVADVGHSLRRSLSGPRTPLETAILSGDHRIIDLLLEAGADPNFFHDKYGRLPVVLAMKHNKFDIFKILLEAKTNLDLRDKYGDTPLIWAARHMLN